MIDFAIGILLISVGASILIVVCAFAYYIIEDKGD